MLPDDGGGEGVGDGQQEGHHGARPASSSHIIIHFKMFKKNYFAFSINLKKNFPKAASKDCQFVVLYRFRLACCCFCYDI